MARIPFSVNQIARAVWAYVGGAAGTVVDRAVNTTFWKGSAIATPATAGVPKVAIEAAGDFAQAAADKVWATAARSLTVTSGFSLAAGSYSIRASSMQRGSTASVTSPGDVTISSVTTTRAIEVITGLTQNTTSDSLMSNIPIGFLNSSTTLRFQVNTVNNNLVCYGAVAEYF